MIGLGRHARHQRIRSIDTSGDSSVLARLGKLFQGSGIVERKRIGDGNHILVAHDGVGGHGDSVVGAASTDGPANTVDDLGLKSRSVKDVGKHVRRKRQDACCHSRASASNDDSEDCRYSGNASDCSYGMAGDARLASRAIKVALSGRRIARGDGLSNRVCHVLLRIIGKRNVLQGVAIVIRIRSHCGLLSRKAEVTHVRG